MQAQVIQRQYDEVIAHNYDLDPQGTTGQALDRALQQIQSVASAGDDQTPLKVLDVGMGTGLYLERLKAAAKRRVQPFGLDLSQKMVDIAQQRLPELTVAVDDAKNLDRHFHGDSFDLICTHFITGFIPLPIITPLVRRKLVPGGYWSFVGGTTAGFPKLQKKANSRLIKLMFGSKGLAVGDVVTNPTDTTEVTSHLQETGFRIVQVETFRPELTFENFDKFMEFGYHGGWLTPFLESLGLHKASKTVRTILNTVLFPMKDSHEIAIVLAQKED